MSIAIFTTCAALEPSSSGGGGRHRSLHFGSRSCRPTSFSLSHSSPSSPAFGARRRVLPVRRKHRFPRIRAVSENLGSLPDPLASSSSSGYHPSEDIKEWVGDETRLTDAETARTLVEVNSKAVLMFSGMSDEEIHENIIWPDLPYLTDEHGDVYFEVSNHEDILQTLIGDDKIVQVIIGLDNIEMLEEMDMSEPSDFDFSIEEITSDDSEIDDDSDEDIFTFLEDDEDDLISSEASNDWSNLETMQSAHPMYFARKIAEVVSNANLDWMDQPSASIVIKGVLRPTFLGDHEFIKKQLSGRRTSINEVNHMGEVVKENVKEKVDKNESLQGGTAFYKLEMIRIQLVSSYGTQSSVEVHDFRKARPDVVAQHSANIISQLEAAGDKTIQALKSFCWRIKSIQVEEASITGLDSLGFDLRVCSGTQVQTLRFAFKTRATSGSNAERQLYDLLFPRFQHKTES